MKRRLTLFIKVTNIIYFGWGIMFSESGSNKIILFSLIIYRNYRLLICIL